MTKRIESIPDTAKEMSQDTRGPRFSCGKGIWALLGAFLILGCEPAPQPPVHPAEVKQFAADANRFALDLFRDLARTPDNLVFSPYGLYEALAMTNAGASGQTAHEFRTLLHATLSEDRLCRAAATLDEQLRTMPDWPKMKTPSSFRVSNGLWIDRGWPVAPSFRKTMESGFQAAVENLDFKGAPQEALGRINGWTARATEGRIPTILERVEPYTRVVLTNAVHFKGGWAIEFLEQNTRPGPFYPLEGRKAETPLMHGGGMFDYAETEGCQTLALDFLEGPFRMLVLLPERKRFRAFEEGLTPERLGRITEALRKGHGDCLVKVTLPRFRLETSPAVQKSLQSLGLKTAFTDAADFSRMSKHPLKIDEILHKAFVSVDEKGAEAAAVTAVVGTDLCAEDTGKPKVVEFKADHPFVFLIQDGSSGAILFMGRYLHP